MRRNLFAIFSTLGGKVALYMSVWRSFVFMFRSERSRRTCAATSVEDGTGRVNNPGASPTIRLPIPSRWSILLAYAEDLALEAHAEHAVVEHDEVHVLQADHIAQKWYQKRK